LAKRIPDRKKIRDGIARLKAKGIAVGIEVKHEWFSDYQGVTMKSWHQGKVTKMDPMTGMFEMDSNRPPGHFRTYIETFAEGGINEYNPHNNKSKIRVVKPNPFVKKKSNPMVRR
jgi:hypothetical protein